MGYCWYCYWGWPKQVADIYTKYVKIVGESGMHFGPGHIVWEDENFGTSSINWCLKEAREQNVVKYDDITAEEMNAVIQSLEELLLVPEEIRCCEPKGAQEGDPENFPPPAGLEMVRI